MSGVLDRPFPRGAPRPHVVEHCDKCGTELEPDQARHQRYRVEHVADDVDTLEGQLCADCVVAFAEWLDAESLPAGG